MKVNVLILSVLMSLVTSVISGGMVSQLKCYTNVEGTEMKLCQEENGFTSCFTKYNLEGQVVGRGCSDKGSKLLFEDHCETFQSKAKVNYFWVNWRERVRSQNIFWVWLLQQNGIAPLSVVLGTELKREIYSTIPFHYIFSFTKGIDGFGQEGLY